MAVDAPGIQPAVAWLTASVPTFILVWSRTMGLFLQAPVYSSKQVPGTVRQGLMICISLNVMYSLDSYVMPPNMLFPFIMLAGSEFLVGSMFGFAANMMFLAIQSAGELAGVQAGLSAASTQNPFTKTNVNAFGTLYFNIGLMVFILINGHLWLLGGFAQSFQLVPLGTFSITPAVAGTLIQMSGVFLAITIQLALPVVIVVFLADLGVGYMSKVAQQASSLTQDLITITKPVAGMTILIVLLPNLMSVTYKQTEGMIKDLDRLLRAAHATKKAGPPGLPPPARVPAGSAR